MRRIRGRIAPTRTWQTVVVMLLAGACAAAPEPPGSMALPAHEGAPDSPTALARGELVGDARARCVWIDLEGRGRAAALWPPGYRATFDPLAVYDAEGEEIARAGGAHDFEGGFVETRDAVRGSCAADRVWMVTAVS